LAQPLPFLYTAYSWRRLDAGIQAADGDTQERLSGLLFFVTQQRVADAPESPDSSKPETVDKKQAQ
jgi:hypothetical protein